MTESAKSLIRKFCTETSVQGLNYVVALKRNSKFQIFLWSLLYATFSVLCLRDFTTFVYKYLKYDVSITFEYTQNSTLNFPAITLCNVNFYQRRVVAPSEQFMVISSIMAYLPDVPEYWRKIKLNKKYCKPKNDSKILPELDNVVNLYKNRGLDGFIQLVGMSWANSVEKCWFKGKEIDCNQILIDHATDRLSLCFTINPDRESNINQILKEYFGGNSVLDKNIESTNKFLSTNGSGPTHSIRLLINVDQNGYCGIYEDVKRHRLGAGFISYIHDHNLMIKCMEKLNTYFHPGKSYSVAIKATNFVRNTEALGRCRSSWKSSENDQTAVVGPNVGEVCLGVCFMKRIYAKCKCFFKFGNESKKINPLLDTRESAKVCDEFRDITCTNSVFGNLSEFGAVNKLCPDCVHEPCRETRYTYRITESLFPPKTTQVGFVNVSRGILDESMVRRNYLSLSFYFDSMTSETIIENQMYNTMDLVYVSGSFIGLFLGMSFLTIVEILQLFARIIIRLIVRGKIKFAEMKRTVFYRFKRRLINAKIFRRTSRIQNMSNKSPNSNKSSKAANFKKRK